MLKILKLSVLLFSVSLLGACSDQSDKEAMVHKAVAIEQGEECHLCGMIIKNFPGPKGEQYSTASESINKFCSTRDLFSYVLQPENKRQVREIYVHDMSKTNWDKPSDEKFIDARTAWFVIDSSKKGAMGKTLGSFSLKEDAEVFIQEFGGKLYTFDEITIDIL